jgi:hypothetical protein
MDRLERAEDAMAAGDDATARRLLTELLQENPEDADAKTLLNALDSANATPIGVTPPWESSPEARVPKLAMPPAARSDGNPHEKEFVTLQFKDTTEGQSLKVEVLKEYSRAGWRVVSESVTSGQFRGGQACCLALICVPLGFLAGNDPGTINVTLER